MHSLKNSHCIVIKIGSALLVDEQTHAVNRQWLVTVIDDVASLLAAGCKVVLVSSGAIALGKIALDITEKSLTLDAKQAAAAVGQIQLLNLYQSLLADVNHKAAQVLLTLNVTEDRQSYINLRNTMLKLLDYGVVPVINENDSVSTAEIRYGDNDRLAARVAQMIGADTLVLLSDIDGLYTADPHKDRDAVLIPEVKLLTPEIMSMGKESHSNYGSGGMATKLAAAQIATKNGCRMLITAGKPQYPISHFMREQRGTWFHAEDTPNNAKKRWLEQHLRSAGFIEVDNGAVNALKQGASLLPIGIKTVNGQFQKGSAVAIVDHNSKKIAMGLSNYTSDQLQKIIGKQSQEIADILQFEGCAEVIHRDNLVLI
jgi:glutamate 5-kinase